MSKALIFSDIHVHKHKDRVNRLQHCLDVLHWAFRQAEQNDCKNIFFLGDLFHERSTIDVLLYIRTFEVFMEHMQEADREMYLLVGNHDMYHKVAKSWKVNSIKPISAIQQCHVIENPTSMTIDGRRIDWLPYTENQIEELKELEKQDDKSLLLGHLAVHGAETNLLYGIKSDVIVEYDNEMIPADVSMFESWDMTLLGHYHGAQQLNNKVEYVGSPLQLSFGEAFQEKHILILDLATLEKTYIKNIFSPKHLIVSEQDIEHENYDLNGNFVRCLIQDMGKKEVLDIRNKVNQEYKVASFDFKQHKDAKTEEEETNVIEDAKSILETEGKMLETWIKEAGIPDGLDEKKVLAKGEEVIACTERKTSS